ncbi:hypothetical protein HYALB_00001927 [Hymenoscyphus albidus]|uniref:Clr5 domain-containing protein n=1 Tax=Hymenoscyphus albidus TaxID=595503 RepID=A0A9N9LFU0_9HELO|nr:hypothetical protein HYALB_00001927 [Hymenoscyphus albidus]
MEEQFGHKGSLKQYKGRLKAWGFDKKNIKDADMRVMLRKQPKRKIDDGKETEFFLNEKQVPPVKMNCFVKRKKLDDDMIAAADMPTPSYITCQTPEPTADIEGTSRDIEAISHDMQVMMTIPEDDEVHNQTESDDVDSKPNNKSIISSSREVLEGPLQNTVDVDSDIPGTNRTMLERLCAPLHLKNHTNNVPFIQRSRTAPPLIDHTRNENLEQGIETSLAPPLELISARYHLSNSPTWYYDDIERSNLLHHLSPALFNTQSPYTAIYKAQSPQYRFGMANSPQLARLLETPPMSAFPY